MASNGTKDKLKTRAFQSSTLTIRAKSAVFHTANSHTSPLSPREKPLQYSASVPRVASDSIGQLNERVGQTQNNQLHSASGTPLQRAYNRSVPTTTNLTNKPQRPCSVGANLANGRCQPSVLSKSTQLSSADVISYRHNAGVLEPTVHSYRPSWSLAVSPQAVPYPTCPPKAERISDSQNNAASQPAESTTTSSTTSSSTTTSSSSSMPTNQSVPWTSGKLRGHNKGVMRPSTDDVARDHIWRLQDPCQFESLVAADMEGADHTQRLGCCAAGHGSHGTPPNTPAERIRKSSSEVEFTEAVRKVTQSRSAVTPHPRNETVNGVTTGPSGSSTDPVKVDKGMTTSSVSSVSVIHSPAPAKPSVPLCLTKRDQETEPSVSPVSMEASSLDNNTTTNSSSTTASIAPLPHAGGPRLQRHSQSPPDLEKEQQAESPQLSSPESDGDGMEDEVPDDELENDCGGDDDDGSDCSSMSDASSTASMPVRIADEEPTSPDSEGELNASCVLNHFPGSFQIGRKDRLWRNLSKMQAQFGKREFSFFPRSFVLPQDIKLLRKAWEDRGSRQKWIIKPPASARGIGIQVIHKWSQMPRKRPLLVQKYLHKPYLISGNKFDLRIYVYVSSYDPLRVYVFQDGLVRFASVRYSSSMKSLSNKFMHLTNYSVNKKNSEYQSNDSDKACQGHKWALKALWQYLGSRGVNTTLIWEKIKDIVMKTIIASDTYVNTRVKMHLRSPYSCHELFGFDVMLDENLKPWVLEVNISPSLHSNTALDVAIKGQMIRDVLNLAGFVLPRREVRSSASSGGTWERTRPDISTDEKVKRAFYLSQCFADQDSSSILDVMTPEDVRVLAETEDELSRKGEFERVFPSHCSSRYLRFFEHPRYLNILLNQWETKYGQNKSEGVGVLRAFCQKGVHLGTEDPAHIWSKSTYVPKFDYPTRQEPIRSSRCSSVVVSHRTRSQPDQEEYCFNGEVQNVTTSLPDIGVLGSPSPSPSLRG
ncbi:hypothetical protein J4Q44_G00150210 [Coregonus suidteri]|uniref:Tubulin polyglutamylase TTLL4 n=1 Tax=Coregonus suidteri TaxID=861788 RepID=A0AAN8LWL6_9TELE